jgi:hypothetical protein
VGEVAAHEETPSLVLHLTSQSFCSLLLSIP